MTSVKLINHSSSTADWNYYQSQEDKPESTCGSSIDYHACIGSYNQLPFWNSIDGEISIFCNSILGYCLGAEL